MDFTIKFQGSVCWITATVIASTIVFKWVYRKCSVKRIKFIGIICLWKKDTLEQLRCGWISKSNFSELINSTSSKDTGNCSSITFGIVYTDINRSLTNCVNSKLDVPISIQNRTILPLDSILLVSMFTFQSFSPDSIPFLRQPYEEDDKKKLKREFFFSPFLHSPPSLIVKTWRNF